MDSKITLAECTQNRISDCVRKCVSIGMTFRTSIRGDEYTTKNKRSPFNQAVGIVANADANHTKK
jgi:hypothetical protein